jgi:hypothetical protein
VVHSAAKISHPCGSYFRHQIARYHWHEREHVCAREGEGHNTSSLVLGFLVTCTLLPVLVHRSL